VASPAHLLRDALKKKLKGVAQVSIMSDGTFSAEPTSFLPTPLGLLNIALGGGLPYGRVTEVYGPEQTGKSMFALGCLAANQKLGGISGYLDTEYATSKKFAKEMAGVDDEELIHLEVPSLEALLETTIQFFTLAPPDVPLALAIDSVAGKGSQKAMEVGFDKNPQMGITPKMLRLFFQKAAEVIAEKNAACIMTNHETYVIGAKPWEDPKTTPGGTALRFWTSTRIRLTRVSMVKYGDSQIIGTKNRATIIKNRSDPPLRKVEFYTMFYPPHRGFDDALTTFMYLKDKGYFLVKKGGWFSLDDTDDATNYRREELLDALRNPESKLGSDLKTAAAEVFRSSWSLQELEPGTPTSTLEESEE
jgi:recombination protein RecA